VDISSFIISDKNQLEVFQLNLQPNK